MGQSPRKFFENTRDGGNGEFEMVSTRLPKNFRRNHPMVSAGWVVGKQFTVSKTIEWRKLRLFQVAYIPHEFRETL
jgi:hypothetical protein